MTTPSGRFVEGQKVRIVTLLLLMMVGLKLILTYFLATPPTCPKICTSMSDFHPGSWVSRDPLVA